MAMPDSRRYPWNLYVINNVEDILFFKFKIIPIFSCTKNEQLLFKKPQLKIISFQNYKHWYLIHTWSEKAFKGTVVSPGIAIFACRVTWHYAYSPFKHKFYYIFATCCRRPVIFLTIKPGCRFTPSGCKSIGISKLEFHAFDFQNRFF